MWWLATIALFATASAQIPSLGWCPDYQPMANFNMNKFLGTWYEAERYFTVTELGSRCVTTIYDRTPEGRILVENEVTQSITGLKRLMVGTLQLVGREGEGRVIVKYSSVPLPYDSELSILDTDYENYAVVWSCSGIGPVHTQNAWVMTRERLAPPAIMQAAYGILDKYKVSRAFFVKTNQADCNILPSPAVEKQIGGKSAGNVDVVAKHIGAKPEPEIVVVEDPPEPPAQPKSGVDNLPAPSIAPEILAPPAKIMEQMSSDKAPMPVPELIMAEADKKEELKKTEEKLEETKPSEEKIR